VLTRGEALLRDGFSRSGTSVRDERALRSVSDPLFIERSRWLGTGATDGEKSRSAAGLEDEDIGKSCGEERWLVKN
jgi:hypothetical protein